MYITVTGYLNCIGKCIGVWCFSTSGKCATHIGFQNPPPPTYTSTVSQAHRISQFTISPPPPTYTAGGVGAGQQQGTPNPAMASQILHNWAKYLQMNFGGLSPQQLAANPLYQQMVRQQQQYWAMLRQQQLLHIQQATAAAGVSPGVPTPRPLLTPAQIQQLQARMALSQSILNQATAHARLQQQQQFLQQTLQQSQQARNSLGQVVGGGSVPTTAAHVLGGASTVSLGQAVRLGQTQSTAVGAGAGPPGSGVMLKPSGQSGRASLPQQQPQSQKVPSK